MNRLLIRCPRCTWAEPAPTQEAAQQLLADHQAAEHPPEPARCERSDLLPAQCGCPTHRGGQAVVDVQTGPPFTAEYGGACARCDGRIQPGDLIARVLDGCPSDGYVHARRCQ